VLSGSLDAEYKRQIEGGILEELSSLTTPPTRLANGTNAVFRSITAGSVLVQIDVDNEALPQTPPPSTLAHTPPSPCPAPAPLAFSALRV